MRSNAILHKIITEPIPDSVGKQLIRLVMLRDAIPDLLKLDDVIDLVIPRGSNKLVYEIKESTKIPVLGHSDGIFHVYVDKLANMDIAKRVVLDVKIEYPAACNAMETLLVHKDLVETDCFKNIMDQLRAKGVSIYGGPKASTKLDVPLARSLEHEYNSMACAVEIVDDVHAAIDHVQSITKDYENQNMCWWLHAIDAVEENNESQDLLKKTEIAILSVADNSRPVKNSSRVRSIDGLKYIIQTGLDSLKLSRKTVIDRIMEIDKTMENPTLSDVESKQYCPNCNHGNGSLCVNCELDQLFQVYEAGLFLVKNAKGNTVIASEDAVEMLKQKTALNHFFRDNVISNRTGNDLSKHRNVKSIQVSKSPSPLEITLKVLKSFSTNMLGKQEVASARKHLLLFEAMRKEYTQARSLSIAQSQYLGAHDEIRMSTTRMHLKEGDELPTTIATLSREEIYSHSLQYSSDKLLSSNKLAHIKGQLRYLKGLAVSNQKVQNKQLQAPSKSQEANNSSNTSLTVEQSESSVNDVEEPCPVCHENILDTKMVFPCGHVLCCKCCLKMTERAKIECRRCQHKYITCPTCRQQADTDSIAYVNENKNNCESSILSNAFQSDQNENSIAISGSYGTKIEAITRRILWLTSSDQDTKILVFSSWNDVLDVLSHALAANNITYIRMKGGRKANSAVSKFRGLNDHLQGDSKKEQASKSKPIKVLLMLLQHGANGLNLLEAQHVILVEPVLNPALEAQAISRVHRVGQEKQTFVHRFIVKNSVEESIHKLNTSRNANSVISTKSTNKNEPILTIEDLESLFPVNDPSDLHSEDTQVTTVSSQLPPSVAAGLAAERRLMQSQHNSTYEE